MPLRCVGEYENGVLTKLRLTDSNDAYISDASRLFGAPVTIGVYHRNRE